MKFDLSETPWKPKNALDFWQSVHGVLSPFWQEKFLSSLSVIAMCSHHPENIKRSISKHKKVKNALGYIYEIEQRNEEAVDFLLDEHHPLHALGITNAHHGDRTTDPFDTQREDLLFVCQICNLKLSLSMLVTNLSAKNICFECAEKVAGNE